MCIRDSVAPVRTENRRGALAGARVAPCLRTAAVDAQARGPARREVADEHVGELVGVAADEVRGVRLDDDVPPVRTDAARQGAAELSLAGGSLGAAAGHADARGGSGR